MQLFVAVQVTTVVPCANEEPDGGEHTTVGVGIPVAVGSVHVAIVELQRVISEGQAPMIGVVLTVVVTEELVPVQPLASVTVTETVITLFTLIVCVVAPVDQL